MPPRSVSATSVPGSTTATATFTTNGIDMLIQQISVQNTAGVGQAEVFLDNAFVCGSSQGWIDSADGDPPIVMSAGATLTVVWTGLPAASSVGCVATFYGEQAA